MSRRHPVRLSWGDPPPARTRALLTEQRALAPSYGEAFPVSGATAATTPEGFDHDRYVFPLGDAPDAFARACEALRAWAPHRAAGIRISPDPPPLRDGQDVVMSLPVGPLRILAACRIVAVVDEPDAFGFTYGTLPMHPEVGEERFVVERDRDGSVVFRITASSRPAGTLMRMARPFVRSRQRRVTEAYGCGMQAALDLATE